MNSANLPVGADARRPFIAGANIERFSAAIEDFEAVARAIAHVTAVKDRGKHLLDDPGPFADPEQIDALIYAVAQQTVQAETAVALLDVYASGFSDETRGPMALYLLSFAVRSELAKSGFSAPVLARAILDVTTEHRRMPEPSKLIDRIAARRRHAANLEHWRDHYADLVAARARRAAKAASA